MNDIGMSLNQRNYLPPINIDLFPNLAENHVKIVLYVHNRPQYLKVVLKSLANPRFVSLKHHWWWMMNTVWDGLLETRTHPGHILFIEEDHFVYPNVYRNLQLLLKLKLEKCPDYFAANLAPSDVKSKGEGWESLIAEKIGNIGYTFNRTVWRKIHAKAKEFCWFDDYNWDITTSFGTLVYTLRGPRTSALHFGKCGLHHGQDKGTACIDNGETKFALDKIDEIANISTDWPVYVFKNQGGFSEGFNGWGGWGDHRDHELCLSFAYMYHPFEVLTNQRDASNHL